MTKPVMTLRPDELHGTVGISAVLPNGDVVLTRIQGRIPEIIRGGEFTTTTGGAILDDPEPSFGLPVTYRLDLTLAGDRHIQSNRIINPRFYYNTTGWIAGTGRTLTQVTDPDLVPPRHALTSARIGENSSGSATPTDISARTLASTVPDGFGPGRWWLTGQIRYFSPLVRDWNEVVAEGTWNDVQSIGTWQEVKSSSTETPEEPFVTLWAAVLSPADAIVVEPFQILGVQADASDSWRTFQAWLDVPVGVPAGSRLVFLQGTVPEEFSTIWWLTTVLLTPEDEALNPGALLPYFDGDTPVPPNPAQHMLPGYDWQTASNDSEITWLDGPHSSRSVFTSPSQVYSEITTQLNTPTPGQIGHRMPIFLSDPVTPLLGTWFELLEIGDLSFAARAELYDILSRAAQVSVAQIRAWPSGELRLLTRTDQQRELVERLFSSGRILFLRNPDPRFPENRWYLQIGTVTNGRLSPHAAWRPERIWRLPFVKVERPEGLIATATAVTWGDVKGQFTWAQLREMREDWLDVAIEDIS